MDLLAELHTKLRTLGEYKRAAGVRAAVRHIEAAERHLDRGRKGKDDDAFTDVIYRTNQAFEGMLKEAYTLLNPQAASNLTPHQIEKKFLSEGIFSPRVITAFQRYRQEWRNPSTHDHTLLFSEQEALLAIVSVSAFAVVLLDQMIEVFSFREQHDKTERARADLERALANYDKLEFDDQIIALLVAFGRQLADEMRSRKRRKKESELLGALAGFLTGADSELRVEISARVDNREVDLIIRKGSIAAPLEIKRGGTGYFLDAASEEVKRLAQILQTRIGFVFMPPRDPNAAINASQVNFVEERIEVAIVAPEPYLAAPRERVTESVQIRHSS